MTRLAVTGEFNSLLRLKVFDVLLIEGLAKALPCADCRHCACASVWQVPQRFEEMNMSPGINVPVVVVALPGEKGFEPNLKS